MSFCPMEIHWLPTYTAPGPLLNSGASTIPAFSNSVTEPHQTTAGECSDSDAPAEASLPGGQ